MEGKLSAEELGFAEMVISPEEAYMTLRDLIQNHEVSTDAVYAAVSRVREQPLELPPLGELMDPARALEPMKHYRAHKHPDAPKRFKSPYICFFSAKQDDVRQKLGPDAKFQDHGKEIGRMWREMPDEERVFWEEQSRLDRGRFEKEKESYEGPWLVENQKKRKFAEGGVDSMYVASSQTGKPVPKGFKTAYICFFSAHQQQVKEDMGDNFTFVELGRKIGELWRALTPEERQIWEEHARLDKLRVEEEQKAHSAMMGQSGRSRRDVPKRPMSAFFHFAAENRKIVVHQHPGKSSGDISKILSEMWKNADEATRKRHYDWREMEKVKLGI